MAFREILNLALSREQASIELYIDLLESYKKLDESEKEIEETKNLLLFLIKEQIQHKQEIAQRIENLNPTAVISQT